MFFRIKKSGGRGYVQVVENKRFDGAVHPAPFEADPDTFQNRARSSKPNP